MSATRWISAESYRWRIGHFLFALFLAWVRTGYGLVFYLAHEGTQAKPLLVKLIHGQTTLEDRPALVGYLKDLLPAVIAEVLMLLIRGVQ